VDGHVPGGAQRAEERVPLLFAHGQGATVDDVIVAAGGHVHGDVRGVALQVRRIPSQDGELEVIVAGHLTIASFDRRGRGRAGMVPRTATTYSSVACREGRTGRSVPSDQGGLVLRHPAATPTLVGLRGVLD